jgi:phosphoglycolate phosphatase-like HAD superfamily hydrolase
MPTTSGVLDSWNDGTTKQAIVEFVESVTRPHGPRYVAPEQRVAVFDNDGTLWCEKPMPPELGFMLERLSEQAEHDPSLRASQPWQAAVEHDHAWLGAVITKHYQGDDRDVQVLLGGVLKAFDGMSVEAYAAAADAYLRHAPHPTLGRNLCECGYLPMVELLGYLAANGFTSFIASGGDRDFMRPITSEIYGIPAERIIGSSAALRYQPDDAGGTLVYGARLDVFDDGPTKPVRIWSRIGRRPLIAVGNSNGDVEMLRFAGGPGQQALRMLVVHDDAEREFDYVTGAERALEQAAAQNWTLVSVKRDWATVFAGR